MRWQNPVASKQTRYLQKHKLHTFDTGIERDRKCVPCYWKYTSLRSLLYINFPGVIHWFYIISFALHVHILNLYKYEGQLLDSNIRLYIQLHMVLGKWLIFPFSINQLIISPTRKVWKSSQECRRVSWQI